MTLNFQTRHVLDGNDILLILVGQTLVPHVGKRFVGMKTSGQTFGSEDVMQKVE